MKRGTRLLCGMWVVGLLGCGGDELCGRWEDAWGVVQEKQRDCAPLFNTVDAEPTCEDASEVCEAGDKERLDRYFGCVEGLNACRPDAVSAYFDELARCDSELEGLSQGCRGAFGVRLVTSTGAARLNQYP